MATTNKKEVKAGWKTTEFWITVCVAGASLLWGADILDPEGTAGADRLFGFAVSALTALGYTVSRGLAKKVD